MEDLDGETGELIAPCSLKKRSLLMTGPDNSKDYEKFDHHLNNLVKHKHSKFSEKASMQNPRENIVVKTSHETNTLKQNVALINQNHSHKDFVSQSSPDNDEEKKGSAFLIQVREKLSDAEYKEFVGFMKALKSKAMKIGHVLQSIARLFSLPDRVSLLHGFKDYVPAKYHSLYEHYLCTNRNAAGV